MTFQRNVYITNESYPELRNLPRGWSRSKAWWRAFASGAKSREFWGFFARSVLLVVGVLVVAQFVVLPAVNRAGGNESFEIILGFATVAVAVAIWVWRTITVGGDMIRPHLRRTTPICGESCPHCGYHLYSQLIFEPAADSIQCPECGEMTSRCAFEEPFDLDVKRN